MSNEGVIPQEQQRIHELLKNCSFDITAQIFSFCDILDIHHLLSATKEFQKQVTGFLSAQQAISFSCLLKGIKNKIKNDEIQQNAVIRLTSLFQQEENQLKHVEFSGLRQLSGSTWLPHLKNCCHFLETLDLSGCNSLDPDALVTFLSNDAAGSSPRPSLRRLSLTGCIRVGTSAVLAIGQYHAELDSLSLGGCSQSIVTGDINWMLRRLSKLKHLDLQTLKRLKDPLVLPKSLESINLSSCEGLRLSIGREPYFLSVAKHGQERRPWKDAPLADHKVKHLVLDALGTPRRGLVPGALMYFAFGRQLCEVHLAGCEQVQDWEVQALAELCGHTLKVFQMQACRISNAALIALGTHCTCLAECNVSACFSISDVGVTALCNSNRILVHDRSNPKRQRHRSTLKSLKIASLPLLTNAALASISHLDSLLVLDIHDCPKISVSTLIESVGNMRLLIDVNTKGIKNDPLPFGRGIRQYPTKIPPGLRYVDQRLFAPDPEQQIHCHDASCCTVQKYSQRLNQSVPMQYMYHCIDCGLIPQVNRGICSSCVSKCHKGHRTYLGSWSRFYCDCSFSGDGGDGTTKGWPSCHALFPSLKSRAL